MLKKLGEGNGGVVLVVFGSTALAFAVAGPIVAQQVGNNVWLSAGLAGTVVVTFIGLIDYAGRAPDSKFTLREVIASTLILTYMLLIAYTAFFGDRPVGEGGQQPKITTDLVNNFTTIIGIVVAFYFGSSAFERVAEARHADPARPPERGAGQQ